MISPGSTAFILLGLEVKWYGIIIAIGTMLSVFLGLKRCEKHGISKDDFMDYILIALPLGILGARLYFVIFNLDFYNGNLLKMINLRLGGLAIHGGLIASMLAIFFVARRKHHSFFQIADFAVPLIALSQAIGRWGNFFNEEAHGGITDFPVAVIIGGVKYHATFLYESIWCLLLFLLLSYINKHRSFTGQTACLYAMLYSFERFFIEILRTDSLILHLGSLELKQAMVLSAFTFVITFVLYFWLKKQNNKRIFH